MELQVLIVDDDLRIAEIHRRYVDKIKGFQVVGMATSLTEAQELLEVLQPDLMLLDIFFPLGNGLEFLQTTRQHPTRVDVILITAAKEATLFREALRGGVFDYILKPVLFSRFAQTLERFRATRQQLDQLTQLDQSEVDRILHVPPTDPTTSPSDLPKGIDSLTLEKVRQIFAGASSVNLTSEEAAEVIGVSRTTVRRYLEYLVGENWLQVDVHYGGVGRPERRYALKSV